MENKFTLEDFVIRIMPGGFLLGILLMIFNNHFQLFLLGDSEFLYTFFFLCTAFILGELLQTLAHLFEPIFGVFFRFRKASEVFLYKNNPVLKNQFLRKQICDYLKLSENQESIFVKDYSSLSYLFERKWADDDLSQSVFWKLYSKVSKTEEMKLVNRSYLFIRVMSFNFFLISIFLFLSGLYLYSLIAFCIFIIFLWRGRGLARGLVFKTVLLNLKQK